MLKRFFIYILFLTVAIASDAYADNSDIFYKLGEKATVIGIGLRECGFIIAGFGLVVFSFMAIFNKISWKNLAYIMLSCFVLSTMFWLVTWVGQGGKGKMPDLTYDSQGEKAGSGSDGSWIQQTVNGLLGTNWGVEGEYGGQSVPGGKSGN